MLIDHQIRLDACRRSARPNDVDSSGPACDRPNRSATIPAPRSRRDCKTTATTTRTANNPTEYSSGHQRSRVNDAVCCDHPNGESHDSQSSEPPDTCDISPIPRRTKLSASTAPAIDEAALANALSCTVTAVTAAKTHP
ncbi:hypothetical protein, partial [Brevibacterium epidermidis]|uniref:hypothetical protein n=1 Tax=Brevibacterium epidermidis TaxID=1698 RepID=UPI001A7E1B72